MTCDLLQLYTSILLFCLWGSCQSEERSFACGHVSVSLLWRVLSGNSGQPIDSLILGIKHLRWGLCSKMVQQNDMLSGAQRNIIDMRLWFIILCIFIIMRNEPDMYQWGNLSDDLQSSRLLDWVYVKSVPDPYCLWYIFKFHGIAIPAMSQCGWWCYLDAISSIVSQFPAPVTFHHGNLRAPSNGGPSVTMWREQDKMAATKSYKNIFIIILLTKSAGCWS